MIKTQNKKEVGRPTEYNEEILKKTRKYIDSCEDAYEVMKRPLIENGKYIGEEDYKKKVVNLPSIEGLSLFLDVNRDTIYEWKKKHNEFTDIIEKLLAKQAKMLLNNGLSGDYNFVISKVILSKHGYREAQDTDVTTNGKDLNINLVNYKK